MTQEMGPEPQESLNTVGSETESNRAKKVSASIVIAVVGVALGIIAIAVVVFLFSEVKNLKNENAGLLIKLSDQAKKTDASEAEVNKIAKLDSTVKNLQVLGFLSALQHQMESGIVTDDFVVKKVTLLSNKENVNATIDLDNQPDMYGKYKGKGAFDLPDRELRAKAQTIIDKVKENYMKASLSGSEFPKWDDKTEIYLTIKNYDIGKLVGNQFTLAGEK